MSFITNDTMLVIEIQLEWRKPSYVAYPIKYLLTTWQRNGPGQIRYVCSAHNCATARSKSCAHICSKGHKYYDQREQLWQYM